MSVTVLDGGVATELERVGMPMRAPWWTTRALRTGAGRTALRLVHERFLTAGAQVLTAATLRCNPRALRPMGLTGPGPARRAVRIAATVKAAATRSGAGQVRVAGSLGPVEDCYRPDLVPSNEELVAEHRTFAGWLVAAGVDLVLVETMNSAREARIALDAVLSAGGEAWVSLVCGAGPRLLSGEPLAPVARALCRDGATAVLVNCTAPAHTEVCLAVLSEVCAGPIGAYPNLEDRLAPEAFAEVSARWRDAHGATLLGGCCGAGPAHIAALASITNITGGGDDDRHPG